MIARRLIIFLKSPVTGRVKTRLAAGVGDAAARDLYLAMVADLLGNLSPLADDTVFYIDDRQDAEALFGGVSRLLARKLRVELAHPGSGLDQEGLAARIGNRLVPIEVQRGVDLGQKMARALGDAFRDGCESAILIGSDIPQIHRSLIDGYFQSLVQSPMVLGPTDDGGYYLVGFRRDGFSERVFEGIAWSTPMVYDQTAARAGALGLEFRGGETLSDIDTVDDLKRLAEDSRGHPHMTHVLSVARDHGITTDSPRRQPFAGG